MSHMQNLKNFIRHGKQARAGQNYPHGDPTTTVSPVNAQQHHQQHHQDYAHQPAGHHAISDPGQVHGHQGHQHREPKHHGHGGAGEYSVAGGADARNVVAQAGNVAAHAQGAQQKLQDNIPAHAGQKYDAAVLQQIVQEEREKSGKLPRYPGLERYILLEKMGDGAFSNVYRARDSKGEQGEVAIKVVRKYELNANQGNDHLHPDFKKQPKTVERNNILKEVQIMRQLNHPNIVQLISFSESRQYYYIVLELCPGGELFHQIVRLTYFSEDLSRHVIVQVAEAMKYLHEEKGVVHRDIKPENLLFEPIPFIPTKNNKQRYPEDEDKVDEGEFIPGVGAGGIGRIKIADFGLSKVVWDTQTMTPCGTVGYTAPEIVKDERYSKSVDMWALGCVLYTLLCGFPPFYDESISVLTEKVARGQYTFLSPWWDDISKPAQDLVSHLLTVDPVKRYTIEQFLEHPWIRGADEPTYAAADAPPLATPAISKQKQLGSPMIVDDIGTPVGATPGVRRDFRSPGAINLREVFDVGYSVHRMEEENKRRKNHPQGYRGAAAMSGLNALDEDDYDSEEDEVPVKVQKSDQDGMSAVEQKMRSTNLGQSSAAAQARQAHAPPRSSAQPAQKGYGQHSPATVAAAKQQVKRGAFELSLDNATLLGRRGKKPHDENQVQHHFVQAH